MKNQKIILLIVLLSLGLSITLGMLDYETQSFWHLLTSDPGNIPALLLFTLVFSAMGILIFRLFLWMNKTNVR